MAYCFIMNTATLLLCFILLNIPRASTSSRDPVSEGFRQFGHFHEPYHARYEGILKLDLLEAGTSTLKVKWALFNLTSVDSVFESTAICETTGGNIVSDKLSFKTDRFQFHHLEADSTYVVCVYLLEKSASTNTSILHYSCENFRTIPLIRPDSVVGVILSVGYLASMVAMGYLAWWRQSRRIKRRREAETMSINSKNKETVNNYGTDGEQESLNKMSASCSTVRCVKFSKQEENVFQYNADNREITF